MSKQFPFSAFFNAYRLRARCFNLICDINEPLEKYCDDGAVSGVQFRIFIETILIISIFSKGKAFIIFPEFYYLNFIKMSWTNFNNQFNFLSNILYFFAKIILIKKTIVWKISSQLCRHYCSIGANLSLFSDKIQLDDTGVKITYKSSWYIVFQFSMIIFFVIVKNILFCIAIILCICNKWYNHKKFHV